MTRVRKKSIQIGFLILAAFIFYGVGQSLISKSPMTGLIMILINSVVVVTIGILFKNILRTKDKLIIDIYLRSRVIEAILLLIGGVFIYISQISDATQIQQISISINKIAYNLGMISLGLGSTIIFYYCLKPRLFPMWICIWGMLGYIMLIFGSVLDISSFQFSMYFLIPGGIFEFVIALWLIFKGQKSFIN